MFTEFSDGKPVTAKFPKIAYRDAIRRYGTDKPDLRNPIMMQQVTEHFAGSGFKVFANMIASDPQVEVWAIPAPKGGSRAFCDRMNAWAQQQGQPGLGYIFWREGEEGGAGPIAKNIGPDRVEAIRSQLGLATGDAAFFVAGRPDKFYKFAGEARTRVGSELGLIAADRFEFCWIVDFPMFEWNEDEKKVDFSHNPFSMPQGGLEALNSKDPLDILAYQYDIVCNGIELSSGAIRNHRPDIMKRAFEIAGYSEDVSAVEIRRDVSRIPIWRPAAWRHSSRRGSDRHAAVRRAESARSRAVPDESAGRGFADGRAKRGSAKQLRELHIRLDLPKLIIAPEPRRVGPAPAAPDADSRLLNR